MRLKIDCRQAFLIPGGSQLLYLNYSPLPSSILRRYLFSRRVASKSNSKYLTVSLNWSREFCKWSVSLRLLLYNFDLRARESSFLLCSAGRSLISFKSSFNLVSKAVMSIFAPHTKRKFYRLFFPKDRLTSLQLSLQRMCHRGLH